MAKKSTITNPPEDSEKMSPDRQKKLLKEKLRRTKLKKYTESFEIFAKEQVKIITKNRKEGLVPFVFNEAQQIIDKSIEEQRVKTGRVRAIVLKARQQGISTYTTARVFWKTKFNSNNSAVVMAHDAPTSEALFEMSKNVIDNMTPEFKPSIEKSNAREINFQDNKSGYRLFTAGSPESGRGQTPTIAHLSEVAFWPYDKKILAGLFQGIPDADDTEVILESTANGMGNEFHRMWLEAVEGKSDYIAIFVPWYITSEYKRAVPPGFSLSEEEAEYKRKFSLTDEQMYWRRLKIAESGELTFKQEYPATPQEAFVVSGASVFDKEKLEKYIPQPIILCKEYDENRCEFVDSETTHGSLKIFRVPKFDDLFLIGGDVSLGVGKDYSTAVVMDQHKRVCALYRNNLIDPSKFGDVLFYLSRYYNNALLGPERNSMGAATIARLIQMGHQNLYKPMKMANVQAEEMEEIGFRTTHTSKPAIIGNLKRAIESDELWIPSTIMLAELKSYIMKDNGGTEAAPGTNDDTVIALAIALEMHRTHGQKLTRDRVPFTQKNLLQSRMMQDNSTWL
jgi:hypothetical protein